MTINSMESFGAVSDGKPTYLDSTKLIEGHKYTCLTFVVNSSAKLTVKNAGYFTFYVKSVDNAILTAQVFNIADFVNKGLTAKYLTHKPVQISFTASIYYGRWSLIVDEIKLWDGDFDRSLFLGKIDVDTDDLDRFTRRTGVNINLAAWKTESFGSLADGNAGAFAVLANSVVAHLSGYNKLWGVELEDLMEVALYALQALYQSYKVLNDVDIITNAQKSKILASIDMTAASSKMHDVIIDACTGVLNKTSSQHLYAVLVQRSINMSVNDMNLIYLYKAMPLGATTRLADGTELMKY